MDKYTKIKIYIYDVINRYLDNPTVGGKRESVERIYILYRRGICKYHVIYQILLSRGTDFTDPNDTFLYDLSDRHNQ